METEDEVGWREQRRAVVNDQSCSSHKENILTALFFFLPRLALHPCVHAAAWTHAASYGNGILLQPFTLQMQTI